MRAKIVWTTAGVGWLFAATLHAGPLVPETKSRPAPQSDPVAVKVSPASAANLMPRVVIDGYGLLQAIERTQMVRAAGIHAIQEYDATHPVRPNGAALIRGANHAIGEPGAPIDVVRAVGDSDGSVFVLYRAGSFPHVRKILADNKLGFDVYIPIADKAGIAPDGAGGVHVVAHRGFDSDGDALQDQTLHTSIRLDAAGKEVWKVAEPGAPPPYTVPQKRSVAARSSEGVYVGYGHKIDGDKAQPVLLHRRLADGGKLFTVTGLVGPAHNGVAAATMGSTPLRGIVEEIWPAADGSVIATVEISAPGQVFVRVDAAGKQTAAFSCTESSPPILAHLDGSVACVDDRPDGTIRVAHYGLRSGNLAQLTNWTSPPLSGWDIGGVAVTPGGQYMVVAATSTGYPGVALLSASGQLLARAVVQERKGGLHDLIAGDGVWQAIHVGADQTRALYRGTFTRGLR